MIVAPGHAFDERDDAVIAAGADDEIHFPVADLGARLNCCGPLGDVALTGQSTALFGGRVALAVPHRLTQMLPQLSSAAPVSLHVRVDRLMADLENVEEPEPAGDLFRTELLAEQRVHEAPFSLAEVAVASGTNPSAVCLLLSDEGTISAVVPRAIPLKLASNTAAVSAESPRHLSLREPLLPKHSERIPLVGGDLVITHDDSFLPEDFVSVPDRLPLKCRFVALRS